ncbi:LuxR C-terminal-related transcriptional regulator [Shimia sp. Alg240-R146]|uniref:LuxR C-terminal-related transcriptional regulator n=1 Tax=Shimia sp. Alg240-R146 TaxID=2993449 RepID=UPI0022E8BECE|nr:LuxR C-terminal-related transcriptional regulator [Shimia sp. Alg240-R146]
MDQYALAFDHAPVGLILLENRVIRRANPRFGEMFGLTPEACKGLPIAEIYASEEDFQTIGAKVYAAIRDTGRYSDERIMKRADGSLFWCRVRGQAAATDTPDTPFSTSVWSFADLSEDRPIVALTQREREVAILTCRGLTSKEIGLDLNLSYRTVEEYRARLLRKFGARKLAELVAKLSGMPL